MRYYRDSDVFLADSVDLADISDFLLWYLDFFHDGSFGLRRALRRGSDHSPPCRKTTLYIKKIVTVVYCIFAQFISTFSYFVFFLTKRRKQRRCTYHKKRYIFWKLWLYYKVFLLKFSLKSHRLVFFWQKLQNKDDVPRIKNVTF